MAITKIKSEPVIQKPVESRVAKKQNETGNESARAKYFMPAQEEKASVLEIIADLETQLEAAFSIKDEQASEIAKLEKELEKAGEQIAIGDAKAKELQELSASQEKLNSYLEFLENERLSSIERVRALEVQSEMSGREKQELIRKLEEISKELKVRDSRLEQMEQELNNAHMTTQNFQNRIHMAQEEKEESRRKLEQISEEFRTSIVEKETYKRDLQQAKEDLDDIRVMLADTRTKAKGHFYKKKA